MTENKTTSTSLAELADESHANHTAVKLTRRQTLLGALLLGAAAKPAVALAEENCICLPAPDCNSICPAGGVPKADGSQACECTPVPGKPRALGVTDGGDAVNSIAWGGKNLRLQHNTTDTQCLVVSGNNVDYVQKSEIADTLTLLFHSRLQSG